jgi:hypothetical protein
MRNISLVLIGGAVIIALGQGLASGVRAGDDERPADPGVPGRYRPWPGGFDVQVLVEGRPLPQQTAGPERRVEAVEGAEYELLLTNPLSQRVAVAVSVDGLNVIDARHTAAWDASKWVIHPHATLTISGWQVGPERARRFYFTTERDAYATRIGRPGDFGVIAAAFYRERRPGAEVVPGRRPVPERRGPGGAAEGSAAGAAARSAPAGDGGEARERLAPSWHDDGRAATGIGSSVPSGVREVDMELDRHPVAVVTLRYHFRPSRPRPILVPRFAPEPASPHMPSPMSDDRSALQVWLVSASEDRAGTWGGVRAGVGRRERQRASHHQRLALAGRVAPGQHQIHQSDSGLGRGFQPGLDDGRPGSLALGRL